MHLHTHVRWCTRLQWSMGVLLLAILVIFYAVGYRPRIRKLQSLQTEIVREQNELRDNENRTRMLPQFAAEVKQLRERVDESKQLPTGDELPEFLKEVTRLGEKSSLRRFAVKPGLTTHGDLFNQLLINLSFDGNFKDVDSFLRRTEEMKRLTRIGSISIKDEQGQPGEVDVQLSMNLYFAPD